MNGQRVSLDAVEATESAEDYYVRAKENDGRIDPVEDAELRRRLRRSVVAAVTTDRAIEGGVRMLRRATELPEPKRAA